jgi:hypothetical protein
MRDSTVTVATKLNHHCVLCICAAYCVSCVQVAGMLDLLRTQGRWEASARLAYQVHHIITSHYHTTLLLTVILCNRIVRITVLYASAAGTA